MHCGVGPSLSGMFIGLLIVAKFVKFHSLCCCEHAQWTGKCIGKKTIKTFYGFLISLSLLVSYVVIFVIAAAAMNKPMADFTPKQ
jgi:uncharacterized membrane protein